MNRCSAGSIAVRGPPVPPFYWLNGFLFPYSVDNEEVETNEKERAMKTCLTTFLMVILIGLVVGVWTPSETAAQFISRLSADRNTFNNTQWKTDLNPPGIQIWQRSVFVPPGDNTLFVTIAASGKTYDGESGLFRCNVTPDGPLCTNPTIQANEADTPGWISFLAQYQTDTGVSVSYTFCVNLTDTSGNTLYDLSIDLASDNGDYVYVKTANFFIDSAKLDNGCVDLGSGNDDPSPEPSGLPRLPPLASTSLAPSVPTLPAAPSLAPSVPTVPTLRLP